LTLPHSPARWAARCKSALVESEKNWVMSTCSVPREGVVLRVGLLMPPSGASRNLLKKSSKMLPPLSEGPPRDERWPLASAAWILQRCSMLGCPPGTMRLMVTLAGLTPHTSHILVAIFDTSPSPDLLVAAP